MAKAFVSPPPSGSYGPGGFAVSGSCSSKAVWATCLPWVTTLSYFCWVFLELMVTASCAATMSASGAVEARSPTAPIPHHSNQDSGTIPAIDSFATHVSRIFLNLPPSWATMFDSGSPLLTWSPNGPVRSAITSGKVSILLSMEADIRLTYVDGSANPPAPVERRAWACW